MSLPPRMTFEQQEQRLRESECVSAGLEIGLAEGAIRERERINGIIDQFIENSDYPEVVSSLQWLQDVIKIENK